MASVFRNISVVVAKPVDLLVGVYQKTLSPDHGIFKSLHPQGYCRFYPTCSNYAREGLQKEGITAIPKITARVVRCQPWSLGGVDHYHVKQGR